MTQILECIYTSAPVTLDGPGYGVVAKSRNLSASLEKFMRARCRYDFLKPEAPARGITVYAHAIHREDGREWHVLSRLLPSGGDYSGRDVFLAHHIAVPADQFTGQSIFLCLLRTDLFRDSWNEAPQLLDARQLRPQSHILPPSGTWQTATHGLAGPQALLNFRIGKRSPLFLIAESTAQNFSLLCEAALLLPPAEQNRITFVSAALAVPQDVAYDWIGLVRQTPLSNDQLRIAPQRTLDLTNLALLGSISAAPQNSSLRSERPGNTSAATDNLTDIPWREDQWNSRPVTPARNIAAAAPLPPVPFGNASPQTPAGGRTTAIVLIVILALTVSVAAFESLRLRKQLADLQANEKQQTDKLRDLNKANDQLLTKAEGAEKSANDRLIREKDFETKNSILNTQISELSKLAQNLLSTLSPATANPPANPSQSTAELFAAIQKQIEILKAQAAEAVILREQLAKQPETQTTDRTPQIPPQNTASGDLKSFSITRKLAASPDGQPLILCDIPPEVAAVPNPTFQLLGAEQFGLTVSPLLPNGLILLPAEAAAPNTPNAEIKILAADGKLQLTAPLTAEPLLARLRCCCLKISSGQFQCLITLSPPADPAVIRSNGSNKEALREELENELRELQRSLENAGKNSQYAFRLEWRQPGPSPKNKSPLPDLQAKNYSLWLIWSHKSQPPVEYPLLLSGTVNSN
jgi:hypothetical protein